MTPTDRGPWYEDENPTRVVRGFSWRAAIFIALIVLFVGGISIGIWAFQTGTSDVKGRGDAVRTKNAAPNRIAAQERFEKLYAGIKVADQRIDVMAAAMKRKPGDPITETNYNGSINYCLGLVADYNAAARSYTSEQFRAADLPHQIDQTDPTTDCKETSK